MNNLTTRKIVLGLLMALVLAFSMQGTADALTLSPSTSPGDLTTLTAGATITLSGISKTLGNAANIETVQVTVDRGATFPSPDNAAVTDYTWTEVDDDRNNTSNGTFTPAIPSSLTITVGTAGVVTVTVSWTSNDVPPVTKTFTHTFYVVPDSAISATAPMFILASGGYRVGVTEVHINPLLTVVEGLPLRYKVTGGGSLSVKIGSRTRSVGNNITSSSAPVYLNVNGRTNRVSVYVEGQDPDRGSASTTFIYRYPRLNKVSGDSPQQLGAPGSRLEYAFTVRVIDASTGSGRSVPGQVVTFTATAGDGIFTEHPNFPNSPDGLSVIDERAYG